MANPTYSLATNAIRSGYATANKAVVVPDSAIPAAGTTISTATIDGMRQAMSANTPLLCKGPDGALGWFTLDAERSTPTVPILKAV